MAKKQKDPLVLNHEELIASKRSFDSDLEKALKEPEEAEVVEA